MSITTCASPLWKVFCGGPYTSHPGSYDISQNKNNKLFVKGKNKSEYHCTLCIACSVSGSWNQVIVWEWQLSLNIHRLGNLKTLENSLEMYNTNLAFSENKPKELRIPETLKARGCQYLLCEIIRKKIRIKPWSLNELGEKVRLVTLCLGGFICSLLLKVSPAVLLCFIYFKFIWAGLQWRVASTGDQHGLLQLAATQPWLSWAGRWPWMGQPKLPRAGPGPRGTEPRLCFIVSLIPSLQEDPSYPSYHRPFSSSPDCCICLSIVSWSATTVKKSKQ